MICIEKKPKEKWLIPLINSFFKPDILEVNFLASWKLLPPELHNKRALTDHLGRYFAEKDFFQMKEIDMSLDVKNELISGSIQL